MLNVVALFGALGAISVPFVFAGVESIGAVRHRLFALAAFGALTAVAHLAQRQPAVTAAHDEPRASTRRILSDGWVVALVVLLALDFGMESIAAGWISTYTIETFPGGPGTTMVGVYWTALMVGRLAGPAIHARAAKVPIITMAGVVVSLAFAGIALAPATPVLFVVVAAAGLALGPMGPTILSVAGARYSRGTGAVFGVLLSLGQVGSVALPWIVARVAQSAGFRTGMLVPAVSAALARRARGRPCGCGRARPATCGRRRWSWHDPAGRLLRPRRDARRHDGPDSRVVRAHLRASPRRGALARGDHRDLRALAAGGAGGGRARRRTWRTRSARRRRCWLRTARTTTPCTTT